MFTSKITYRVSRLGLLAGEFPTRDEAYAFVTKHCASSIWYLLTDYKVEAIRK